MEAPLEIKELSNILDAIVQCGKSNAVSSSSIIGRLAWKNNMNNEHTDSMSDKVPTMSCISDANVKHL